MPRRYAKNKNRLCEHDAGFAHTSKLVDYIKREGKTYYKVGRCIHFHGISGRPEPGENAKSIALMVLVSAD